MNASWRDAGWFKLLSDPWSGAAVVAGAGVAAATMVNARAPLLALGALLGGFALLYVPGTSIAFIFMAILLDTTVSIGIVVGGIPLTGAKIAVATVITVHVLRVALIRDAPLFRYHPVVGGLLLVIGSMMMSMSAAGEIRYGWIATLSMVMLTALVLLVDASVDERNFTMVARVLTLTVIGAMLYALMNTDYAVAKGGTVDTAWATRASGTTEDPNEWCTMLVLVVPLCAGLLVNDQSRIADVLRIGMLLLYPISVVQSFSRAGFVGLLLTLPGLLYINWRNRVIFLAALAVFAILAPTLFNLEAVYLRYQTILNPELESDMGHQSMNERGHLLRAAIAIFFENPFIGVGVGMFPVHASYVTAGGVWKIAHNTYASVAAEQGLVGLAMHAVFAAYVLRAVYRAGRYCPDERWRNAALGIGTALIGFGFMALTLNLLEFSMLHFVLGILVYADRLAEAAMVDRRVTPQGAPSEHV